MMSFKVVLAFIVVAAANAGLNDGTTAAGGSGCYCGTSAGVTAPTSFCNVNLLATGVVSTAATGRACPVGESNGNVAATVKCACGSDAVATAVGAFCFQKTDAVKAGLMVAAGAKVGPACPAGESTGAVAATAKCYCGTSAAVTIIGSFCNTALKATGVVSTAAEGPMCPTGEANGNVAATAVCVCGSDKVATAVGAFCFQKTDAVKAGLMVAANAKVGPACPAGESTGAVAATAKCYCGTSAAVTIITSFCSTALLATGTVSTAAVGAMCPTGESNGNVAATVKCACGGDKVATAVGAFCFVKANAAKTGLMVAAGAKVGPACVGPPTATPTATPTKAPTAAVTNATTTTPTPTPTPAKAITIKQVATLGIAAADYNVGLVKQLTERAMSITLGACSGNCTALTNGYTMSSAASRRASCTVTFTVGVPDAAASTAVLTKGKAITKDTLSKAITDLKAADTTYKAVSAPDVKAVVAPTGGSVVAAASTTAVSMFSAFCLSMVALRQ